MLQTKIALTSALALIMSSGIAMAGDYTEKDKVGTMADKAHNNVAMQSSRIKADWVDALDIQDEDKADKIREVQASYWSDKEDLTKEMAEIEEKKNEQLQDLLSEDQLEKLQIMERGHTGREL